MPLELNATQWGEKKSISCEVKQLGKVNEAKASARGKPGGQECPKVITYLTEDYEEGGGRQHLPDHGGLGAH